jgi:acyl-homoserine lactone acylase PvdQ
MLRVGPRSAIIAAGAALLIAAPTASAQSPAPYGQNDAGGFRNILPAGEQGLATVAGLAAFEAQKTVPPHFNDQLPMYENLVYAAPTLTDAQVPDFYKDATFGVPDSDVASVEHPEPGLTIVRDQYDVPHIYGDTRAEVTFGTGYAAAEDRLFLIDVLRHTAEAQLASFVGGSASNRAMDETQWGIAPYTQADLQEQIDLAPKLYGAQGTQLVQDGTNFVDGINAYIQNAENPLNTASMMPSEYAALGTLPQPWKLTDVIAEASLIGGIFGLGGGGQVDSAITLQKLEQRLGKLRGRRAWSDFREVDDPESPSTITGKRFPYELGNAFSPKGLALPDPGSVTFPPIGSPSASSAAADRSSAAGPLANIGANLRAAMLNPTHASNWELIAARHSANGHPLAVMGPQVGYYIPEILMEEDLHGPGIDARGASFPGVNQYVELGHGRDYAWSATTSTSDNVSTYAEVLCQDAYHYLYKGRCLAMDKLVDVDSWHPNVLDQTPPGTETMTAYRTVHGIVYARGAVHGKPVAFVHARSTYFHEADSAIGFSELNDPGYVTGPAAFQQAASHINFLFNWGYVDANHTSYYMSGWMPQFPNGVSAAFPVLGTGQYDWKGYDPATHDATWLPFAAHPHTTDQDYMVSWNNKQAPGWSAADNQWGYGPVYRNQMIAGRIAKALSNGRKIRISQVVSAMDVPSTEDIRALELPILFTALGRPANPKLRAAIATLRQWYGAGGFRKSASLATASHDLYAQAIELMDAWWPRLLENEFEPMIGSGAFGAIQTLLPLGGEVPVSGDGFNNGWWGYVSKDLRRVYSIGHERAPYSQAYCGNLPSRRFSVRALRARCTAALRASLLAATSVTPQQLYGAFGSCSSDPEPACVDQNTWTDASAISLPSFPFQNRPTFQQVVTLTRKLPR